MFVPVTDGSVMAFDAATGASLWKYALPAAVASEPVLSTDDALLIVGCHDGNIYSISTAPEISTAVNNNAQSITATHTVAAASRSDVRGNVSGGGGGGGRGGVGGDDSRSDGSGYDAVVASSNRVVWTAVAGAGCKQDPANGCGVQSDGILSIDGNVVYMGSDDGTVYALRTSDGTAIWKHNTGLEPVQCGPTLSINGTILYFGSFSGKIWAIEAATGAAIWTYDTGGAVGSKPVLSGDGETVFQGSFDGYFYALDARNGILLWKYDTKGAVHSDPAVDNSNGLVFGASYSGELFALSQAGKVPSST